MKVLLNRWNGAIEIDGVTYKSSSDIPLNFVFRDGMHILLKTNETSSSVKEANSDDKEYRFEVKQYMTKKATPEFDFMAKFNNDEPMPLRIMVGKIIGETRGMYKVELHCDTKFEQLQTCMMCGRAITNPVSKYFGMGPECGQHHYVSPFDSDEELQNAIKQYKEEVLAKLTWEGWLIKSAITKMEEYCE